MNEIDSERITPIFAATTNSNVEGAEVHDMEVQERVDKNQDPSTDQQEDTRKELDESATDPESEKRKIREDIHATHAIFNQIETQTKSCASLIQDWIQRVKSGKVSTEKGLTYLEMKNHSVLNYLISLTGLILNKCSGMSIQGSSYLDQLIESRVILEKIRPIDQKLKYQIDKLVRIAVEGKVETNDPLMYKANLDNLTSTGGDEFDEESDNDIDSAELDETALAAKAAAKSDGIYRPPKVAPQHYDEELPKGKSPKEGRKRPEVNRNLIRELQEEYLETPVEVHNMGDAYVKQLSKEIRDKQRFEESYMTRLPVTKQDKHKERSMSTLGVLGDELTDFTGKRARSDGPSKSKKAQKRKASKAKSRGGKKRFRK